MRHADGDLDHAVGGGGLDHGVQRRDGDLAAFQAEALGGDVALLAERLEALRPRSAAAGWCAFRPAFSAVSQGAPSTRRWIQDFWSGSWMCMNSTPIGPQ